MSNRELDGKVSHPNYEIIISVDKKNWMLGESIPVSVHYKNNSTHSWEFLEPENTWEVKIAVSHAPEGEQAVPFGQITFYESEGMERRIIEPARMIELGLGEVYQFDIDVGSRWPQLFSVGPNLIRIKDYTDKPENCSNKIELKISIGESTFPTLLGILMSEEASLDTKHFANLWIERIYPDFSLNNNDITQMQRAEYERHIADALVWWKLNRKSPETLDRISKLNSEPESGN